MAVTAIFWTMYLPLATLALSVLERFGGSAIRSHSFEHASWRSLAIKRFGADGRDT